MKIRELVGGRPSNPGDMHPIKLRAMVEGLGGVARTARIIAVPRTTLSNYVSGRSSAPPTVVEELQSAWRRHIREEPCQVTQNP